MRTVRLPKVFLDDHADRELPTPEIIRETARHYIVADDDAMPELWDDARHYADPNGPDELPPGLRSAAIACERAIAAAYPDSPWRVAHR